MTSVYGDRFETIEGNTSGASGIISNGGGVCRKSYYNSQLPGTKFCRPEYSILEKEEDSSESLSESSKWTGRVTASSLNVRQWAGTEYPKLKSCPVLFRGKTVEICDVVKANNGENWYYVRINGKIYGFVCGQYVEKISCFLYRWKRGTLRI